MCRPPPIDCRPPQTLKGKPLSKSASRARLAEIIRKRSFGRGEITLASGRKSDLYFNLKPTMLDPEGAALLAKLTYEALKDDKLDFCRWAGDGAVPLAGAIAQLSWLKGHRICRVLRAQEAEGAWRGVSVEGLRQGRDAGRQADRDRRGRHHDRRLGAESGGSRARGRRRDRAGFTMVDREEGATETFSEAGLQFRSLYKAGEFLKD